MTVLLFAACVILIFLQIRIIQKDNEVSGLLKQLIDQQNGSNIYEELEDIMRDDEWGRITSPKPPQDDAAEPPRHLIHSIGKRDHYHRS